MTCHDALRLCAKVDLRDLESEEERVQLCESKLAISNPNQDEQTKSVAQVASDSQKLY